MTAAPTKTVAVVAGDLPDDVDAALASRYRTVRLTPAEARDAGLPTDAEGLLVAGVPLPVTAEMVGAVPGLRVVALSSVGYDRVDVDACTAAGAWVTNTPEVLDGAVADLTVLLMLSVARRLSSNSELVRSGRWFRAEGRPKLGTDVRGKTLGIVGMGRIGQTVARTMHHGFGMEIVYYNPSGRRAEPGRPLGLDELLGEADVVSVHVALTPETTNLIGAREIALMKPGAVLLNTSRGQVVDQAALVDALRGGRLGGAGLDVMAREPLDPNDPLCALPNVVLTPHIASATVETRRAMLELAVENLDAVLSGRPPSTPVNEPSAR